MAAFLFFVRLAVDNLTFAQRLYLALIPALATVLAAYIAVYFSIRKFYAEKLWEKRLEAYTKILGTLGDLHQSLVELQRCFEKKVPFENEEEVRDFKSRSYRAAEQMDRLELIGPFLIPRLVWGFITELHGEIQRIPLTSGESIEEALSSTRVCIAKFRNWADSDLQKRASIGTAFEKIREAFKPFE